MEKRGNRYYQKVRSNTRIYVLVVSQKMIEGQITKQMHCFRFPSYLSSWEIDHQWATQRGSSLKRSVFVCVCVVFACFLVFYGFKILEGLGDGANGDNGGKITAGKATTTIITIRLGDTGPKIDQVQHCNTITQGQEERIPKT